MKTMIIFMKIIMQILRKTLLTKIKNLKKQREGKNVDKEKNDDDMDDNVDTDNSSVYVVSDE